MANVYQCEQSSNTWRGTSRSRLLITKNKPTTLYCKHYMNTHFYQCINYRNQKHKIWSSSDWGDSKQTVWSHQLMNETSDLLKQVFKSAGNWIQHTSHISITFSISRSEFVQKPQTRFRLTANAQKMMQQLETSSLNAHPSLTTWPKHLRKVSFF